MKAMETNIADLANHSDYDQILKLQDSEIVDRCKNAEVIDCPPCGRQVVKLSQHVAVKIGWSVSREESITQAHAARMFNSSGTIHVPNVLRFFQQSDPDGFSIGYLLMEYVHGKTLEDISEQDQCAVIQQIVAAVHEMQRKTSPEPRTVHGLQAVGFPWGDEKTEVKLNGLSSFQHCVDKRLKKWNEGPFTNSEAFVFSHLDLARRNMIRRDDNSLCILDWESAGYYPASFQLASFHYLCDSCDETDKVFFQGVLAGLGMELSLDHEDNKEIRKVLRVQAASIRFMCS